MYGRYWRYVHKKKEGRPDLQSAPAPLAPPLPPRPPPSQAPTTLRQSQPAVHGEVTQFTNGLDEVGKFYKTLMMAPDVLQPLFVPSDNMTFESLRQMYVIDYSGEGSNNRRLENNVVCCFEAFLADCELGSTEVSLGDVLAFWTGADSVPPLGFSSPLHIDFIGGEAKQLPSASTCGMVLHLWRGYGDAELFARDFVISIQMGGGFYLDYEV